MSVILYISGSTEYVDLFNIYTGSLVTGSNMIASGVSRADLIAGYCVDTPSLLYTIESATTYCTSLVYVQVDAFDCALTVSASNASPVPTPIPVPVPAPTAPVPAPVAPVPIPVPAPVAPIPVPIPVPAPVAPVPVPVAPVPVPVPAPVVTLHSFYVSSTSDADPCNNLSANTEVFWADPDAITGACGAAQFIPPSGTQLYANCAGTVTFTGGGSGDHLIEQPGTGDDYYGPITTGGIIGATAGC